MLKKSANIWVPLLVIVAVCGLTLVNMRLPVSTRSWDEFAPRWTAARLWLQKGYSPYSEETHTETLAVLEANGFEPDPQNEGYFMDPAFYLIGYLPFSFIPFPLARAIWMTVTEVSILASAYIAIKLAGPKFTTVEVLLFCLSTLVWYPCLKLVLTGSVLPPFIFLVLLGCYHGLRKDGVSAGIFFALAAGMIPVSLVAAIFFLIWLGSQRQNEMSGIFISGLAFLLVTSIILFEGWLPDWFTRVIQLRPGTSWIDTPLVRLAGLIPTAATWLPVLLHAGFLLWLIIEWYSLPGSQPRVAIWKLMLTLNLLYLFNLHSEGAYLLLLWPALLLIFRFVIEKWRTFGKIIFWIFYSALVYFYWTRSQFSTGWQLKEPTSLVLILPAVTLIGLIWFHWWATKSPAALVDKQ